MNIFMTSIFEDDEIFEYENLFRDNVIRDEKTKGRTRRANKAKDIARKTAKTDKKTHYEQKCSRHFYKLRFDNEEYNISIIQRNNGNRRENAKALESAIKEYAKEIEEESVLAELVAAREKAEVDNFSELVDHTREIVNYLGYIYIGNHKLADYFAETDEFEVWDCADNLYKICIHGYGKEN